MSLDIRAADSDNEKVGIRNTVLPDEMRSAHGFRFPFNLPFGFQRRHYRLIFRRCYRALQPACYTILRLVRDAGSNKSYSSRVQAERSVVPRAEVYE